MEAAAEFRAAEAMQQDDQPEFPWLYSLSGFRYCDLLLSQRKFQEVQTRAHWMLEDGESMDSLLSIALYKLVLGCAYLGLALQTESRAQSTSTLYFVQAADWLRSAVDGLQQAEHQDELPRGLLARAAWARVAGQFDRAARDLAEAFTIAERGSMRLHLVDCHLESTRLALATDDRNSARKAWETAKAMIEEMGYHRRDGDLVELAVKLS
jgi:hypothetical protein